MKIISWNVRGLGSRSKRRNIKDSVCREKLEWLFFKKQKKKQLNGHTSHRLVSQGRYFNYFGRKIIKSGGVHHGKLHIVNSVHIS